MSPNSKSVSVLRAAGELLEQLDQNGFWRALVRQIKDYAPIDTWMVLIFSASRPLMLDLADVATAYMECSLVAEYAAELHLVDPFYVSNRERPNSSFFHLSDIAPEFFQQSNYCKKIFTECVLEDEVHYNVQLDQDRTLCLSIGSKSHFSAENIVMFERLLPWVASSMRLRIFFEETRRKLSELQPLSWQETMNDFMKVIGAELSDREREVIRLVLSDCSNKEVAEKLGISVNTVKSHRLKATGKLNVKSPAALFTLFLKTQTASTGGR